MSTKLHGVRAETPEAEWPTRREASPTAGWIGFALVMLAVAAVFNVIDGILAIARSSVFVGGAKLVFGDLRTWGWIILALGIVEGFAALRLLSGSQFARWFGIAVAALNAIGQLLFVNAHPWWALAVFAADVLVVYALAVHGGSRFRRPEGL